jgi:hypothetical protein
MLAGCVVQQEYVETPPPGAEIILSNVNDRCVRRLVENGLMGLGWTIRGSDSRGIIGVRASRDPVADILFSRPRTGAPEERLIAQFVREAEPENMRITFIRAFVSNQGTPNEKGRIKLWSPEQRETIMGMKPKIENSCSN